MNNVNNDGLKISGRFLKNIKILNSMVFKYFEFIEYFDDVK